MKKSNVIKMKKKKLFEIFCENHYPTRHIKIKMMSFAPSNKSIMAKKLHSTHLERFLRRIKFPLTR